MCLNSGLSVNRVAVEQVLVLLRLCNARVDLLLGPVVVLEALEVTVFPLEEGCGGDFRVRLGKRLLVYVEVALVEALVRQELKLVVFLCRAVLRNNVLVSCNFRSVLALEDIWLAGVDACE